MSQSINLEIENKILEDNSKIRYIILIYLNLGGNKEI